MPKLKKRLFELFRLKRVTRQLTFNRTKIAGKCDILNNFQPLCSFLQVLLGQPPSAELYGFVADYLEHKLQERAGSSMTEERPESINFRRMESQNSFDRNIDEITRASVQSATMDHTTPSPKKRILRREGTFSIYDSGKQKTNNKLMT